MAKRIGMEVSIAVAEAVRLANADVISAYPITPQTHIVEHLSELSPTATWMPSSSASRASTPP